MVTFFVTLGKRHGPDQSQTEHFTRWVVKKAEKGQELICALSPVEFLSGAFFEIVTIIKFHPVTNDKLIHIAFGIPSFSRFLRPSSSSLHKLFGYQQLGEGDWCLGHIDPCEDRII